MRQRGKLIIAGMLGALFCLGLGGCAKIGHFARRRADKAATTIIREKQREALGQAGAFSLDGAEDPTTRELLGRAARLDWGNDAFTTPTTTLKLAEALALAVANNRDYKTQREALYSQALALTETRRNFGPIFNASGSAQITHIDGSTADAVTAGAATESFGSRAFSAGVSQVLATGATIGLNFSHQFTRFLTGDPLPTSVNTLSLSAVQPLLNGVGPLVTLEPLRQDERSMIYAVRAFRRYQQGFIIEVASGYYGLLASQDQLHNALRNYQSALLNWRKLKRYAQGGKSTEIEVGQARQKVLEAEAGLSDSQQGYSRQLDLFKLFLGLPVDLDIGPDHRELEAVAARGLLRPDMTLRKAIDLALKDRLDLATARQAVEDSGRKLSIAEQNFLPTLDAFYNYGTSDSGDKERLHLDLDNRSRQYGLNLVLPLDWTLRRNAYVRAQLVQDQARRAYDQARDSLILEVRDDWRQLEQLRTNYRIQQESVALAERQVKSTSMLLQMGRATARDLLDAQDALLASRNAATAALVSHTIERLRFWNAIERLEIDPKGMWYENAAPTKR